MSSATIENFAAKLSQGERTVTAAVSRSRWPIYLVIVSVAVLLYGQCRTSVQQNGNTLVYGLDDAYIHMAISRSLAEHAVWGISPREFTGASSSPSWTLLLAACFKVAGTRIYIPLLLTMLFSLLLLVTCDRVMQSWCPRAPSWFVLLGLTAVFLLTPVDALVFGGMEHAAQVFLVLLFVTTAAVQLESNSPGIILMSTLSFALAATRYESLVLIGITSLLFWARRQKLAAITYTLAALVPITVYAAESIYHGWSALPNSILAKTGGYTFLAKDWFYFRLLHAQWNLRILWPLIAVAVGLYLARWHRRGLWERTQLLLGIFVVVAVAHCSFAELGWLFRYEAYLWGLATFAITAAIATETFQTSRFKIQGITGWVGLVAILVALLPLGRLVFDRARGGLVLGVEATNDRYLEHIQQARFLQQYYDSSTIVMNDIGAPSFFTNTRILDLAGLANREPLLFARRHGRFTPNDMYRWAAESHARIAIVKPEWHVVAAVTPKEWILVGWWIIPRNVVFGDHIIAFYATNPAEVQELAMHIDQFAAELPPSVRVSRLSRAALSTAAPSAVLDKLQR